LKNLRINYTTIILVLFCCPLFWGANFTAMKIGLQYFPAIPYNTTRLILATAIAWVFVLALKAHRSIDLADIKPIVMVTVLGFALPQIGITMGVSLTTAGNCSIIMALIPISVLILNWIFHIEDITRRVVGGILISVVGVVLIVFGTGSGLSISAQDLTGIILMLVTQAFCAYYTIFSKALIMKYSPYQFIAMTLTVSSLVFMIISLPWLGAVKWTQIPAAGWGSVVYSALFALALGNFIWGWGITQVGSTRIAVLNNLTPLFAISTGVLLLKEHFTILQMLGAVIVITGVYMTKTRAEDSQTARMSYKISA